MAEFDDERPDFDAVFRDPPGGDDPPAGRRRASRRRDRDFDLDDSESTGEVPRPRLSGGAGEPVDGVTFRHTAYLSTSQPRAPPGSGGRSPVSS